MFDKGTMIIHAGASITFVQLCSDAHIVTLGDLQEYTDDALRELGFSPLLITEAHLLMQHIEPESPERRYNNWHYMTLHR